jgi:hypothetical protein
MKWLATWSIGGLSALASAPALGASPAVSRGEVLLETSFEQCMELAKAAFLAEDYKVSPPPPDQEFVSYVLAHRDIHTAYITCSPAPKFDMWANIFVASYTQDRNTAGNERLRLQNRIEAAKTPKVTPVVPKVGPVTK